MFRLYYAGSLRRPLVRPAFFYGMKCSSYLLAGLLGLAGLVLAPSVGRLTFAVCYLADSLAAYPKALVQSPKVRFSP